EMHGDHRVPLLLAHVEDHPLAEDAGAADEDVQVAKRLERGVDRGAAARHGRHALGARHRAAAARFDLLRDRLGGPARGLAAVHADAIVVDDHAGPGRGQAERHRATDSASRPRHHRDLAVEQPHGSWPPVVGRLRSVRSGDDTIGSADIAEGAIARGKESVMEATMKGWLGPGPLHARVEETKRARGTPPWTEKVVVNDQIAATLIWQPSGNPTDRHYHPAD